MKLTWSAGGWTFPVGNMAFFALLSTMPAQATFESLSGNAPASHHHVLPIFGQKVSFNLPQGWKKAHFEEHSDMVTAEFVPEQEALSQWSSLFCVQGFKGMASNVSPERFLDAMAQTYESSCQGEVIYQKLGDTQVDGREGYHAILGCTTMPNVHGAYQAETISSYTTEPKGEIGHYTVVSGDVDLYLLHKSIRGAVFDASKPPLHAESSSEFMSAVTPFSLH